MPMLSARPLAPANWPTALLPGLRLLWQRTLFPGRSEIDSRIRAFSLFTVIVLPAVLLYPCMDFFLLDPDEGRYAEIPREMLVRGEWVVPYLHGQPYLDKPPLFYWLVMLSYSLFGVHDWAARIVPAIAVHATILTTYLIGRNRLGERPAFFGAVLLSLTPGLMSVGRLLLIDGLLTLWVTLGLLTGWTAARTGRGWTWCAIACGLGVLTKGPVTLVLVLVPLALDRWLFGREALRTGRQWAAFGLIVLAINMPWYAAIALARPEFGLYFFVQHNLQRFLTPFDHLEPVWYYVPVALVGLLPASFLLWGLLRHLLSGEPAKAASRTPQFAFALLAGAWCIAFFSLSGSKLPTYILPAFPMLCLALGTYIASKPTHCNRCTYVLVSWFVLMLVGHYIALPWYSGHRSPMGAPAAELRAACSDPNVPVCCYPRSCDSAGFYLEREDLQATRSKLIHLLIADLLTREKSVVLCTHGHSFKLLKDSLPPELTVAHSASFRRTLPGPAWLTRIVGDSPWGLCDVAVIHNSRPQATCPDQSN